MIIGIVAIADNLAIGKDGKLPWHYSADLKFFKETTSGNAVVMGMTTWRSIGRPLPDRLNIVLTRSSNPELPDGVVAAKSVEEVIELSGAMVGDLYIIGGASVYEAFADRIDRWIVTYVPLTVADADVFMPADFLDGFTEMGSRDLGEGLIVKTMQRIAT